MSSAALSSSLPAFRVVSDDLSSLTLRELYIELWKPKRNPRTAYEDLRALTVFEEIVGKIPASKLEIEHCWDFRLELEARIASGQIESQNTAGKWCRSIGRFLKLAGPSSGRIDPRNQKKLQPAGVLTTVLQLEQFEVIEKDVEELMELEESEQFLAWLTNARWVAHSGVISNPPRMDATSWWRAVWVLCYNTGMRREEFVAWRCEWIEKSRGHYWANLPAKVTKTKKSRSVYLNEPAMEAVNQLRKLESPTVIGWPHSAEYLGRVRRWMFEQAGLKRCIEEEIGFHGLRRACATEIALAGGGAEIAAMHLGQKLKSVVARHYLHKTAVIPYVNKLPQPRVTNSPSESVRYSSEPLLSQLPRIESPPEMPRIGYTPRDPQLRLFQ